MQKGLNNSGGEIDFSFSSRFDVLMKIVYNENSSTPKCVCGAFNAWINYKIFLILENMIIKMAAVFNLNTVYMVSLLKTPDWVVMDTKA